MVSNLCGIKIGFCGIILSRTQNVATYVSILLAVLSRTKQSWGSGFVQRKPRFRDIPGNPGVLRFKTHVFCISAYTFKENTDNTDIIGIYRFYREAIPIISVI